ncbi:hypothetical protein AAZX31_14G138000 [Glycine max]
MEIGLVSNLTPELWLLILVIYSSGVLELGIDYSRELQQVEGEII